LAQIVNKLLFLIKNFHSIDFTKQTFILVGLFLCLSTIGFAQKQRIKLLNADELKFDDSQSNARKLIGNVRFKHNDMIMDCDSAYLYAETNTLYAYSNVKMVRGDSITIIGDSLKYFGDSRTGKLRGNAMIDAPNQLLRTNFLDFDAVANTVSYYGGGNIINKANAQTLYSRHGFYNGNTKVYNFKDSVRIVDSNYTISADTLQYNLVTEYTRFLGPTNITSDSSFIYCESGFYNQETGESEFNCNAYLQNKDQIIEADSIFYQRSLGYAHCYNDVVITDTTNNIKVFGDYGYYNEVDSTSLVTGNAEMLQAFKTDSLFLHADTLRATKDSVGNNIIQCFWQVQFYKPDLKGKCDSLTIGESDSLLKMFGDPVIWNKENQITGERIDIKTYDGIIDFMEITQDAFIISQQDTSVAPSQTDRYNQIKGRHLMAYFRDNNIYKIDIEGNGQTIYYATEEDGSVFGLNKLDCSNMTMYMESNQIKDIRFYIKPDATLYPTHQLTPDLKFFRYFKWRYSEQPQNRYDIFDWKPLTEGNGLTPTTTVSKEGSEEKATLK